MKHFCKCGKELTNIPSTFPAVNTQCTECFDATVQHAKHFEPRFGHAISYGETGRGGEPRKGYRRA